MSEVVIAHTGDRYGLLAAALLRGKLGRGRAEIHRPETILRFLRRGAQRPAESEVYILGLNVRAREATRVVALLEKFARAKAPVCWVSHRSHNEEIAAAVKRYCRPESVIAPARQESVSLVRDRFGVDGPVAERFVWTARKPELAEQDDDLRPWLYALDRVESQATRHPGYLQQLIVRLAGGFPDEMNSIDRQLYLERATAVRRSRDHARAFITREFEVGRHHIALADMRGETTADWQLVSDAVVGSEHTPLADVIIVLANDGSVRLRARSGLELGALLGYEGDSDITPDSIPGLFAGETPGVLLTRPGYAGFKAHENRPEIELLLATLARRLGGESPPATAAAPAPVVSLVADGDRDPVAPRSPEHDELARQLGAARNLATPPTLAPVPRTAVFAPLPVDLGGHARLLVVKHAGGSEPDGLALTISDEAATPLGGGVFEDALQSALETSAELGLGHLYLKTPDGRYGAAEVLAKESCTLVDPVSPQAAPVPWDGGHYTARALREDWQNEREFSELVHLVRVDPQMEIVLETNALRLCYRGIRVLELRRRGRSVLGPDREGLEFATRRFRHLGKDELSQVARLKRAIDQALDSRGARRARVPEIAGKVLCDNRAQSDSGYFMIARDVTFPEARHLRLHLLAVNRHTGRLAALHVAVPGTMSYPRWPLRSLRICNWLKGPRLRTVAADAERILAQKTDMKLPGYEKIAVDGSSPIETVILVPRGSRQASDEFEGRFAQVVGRLAPEGGLRVVELDDWAGSTALVPPMTHHTAASVARL